ncbi:MAG: 4'-phosphopantetheinyl transferase superfamily protein [Desulfobacterales bacterium]|nr:4'-phosphopantetheinyl transferase superfamily protein [Desulfobacterales bacterium]
MKCLIDSGSVHLWWEELDVSEDRLRKLSALLSAKEQERAGRFVYSVHRRRFVAARAMLRLLLGSCLAIAPGDVAIASQETGKPCLENSGMQRALCFNLSHSHGVALFGLAVNRRIGVDVERIDGRRDTDRIARRFFSFREARAMSAESGKVRPELFFRYWTIKEAYLKATGEGIGRLESVEVWLDEGGGCRILDRAVPDAERWTIRPLCLRAGYAAAVAFEGEDVTDLPLRRVFDVNYTNL